MPINNSGLIALGSGSLGQSINLQLGKSMTAYITMNDNDVRVLAGKVGINPISFSDFYGKPTTPSVTPSVTPSSTPPPPTPSITPSVSPPTIYLYYVVYCTTPFGDPVQISSADPLSVGSTYSSGLGCFTVSSSNNTTSGYFPDIPSGNAVLSSCDSTACNGGPQQ